MTADQVEAYVVKTSRAYFAAQPITDALNTKEERDEALKWIDDTRGLLMKVANYIMDHEAANPSKSGKALLKEIERLAG